MVALALTLALSVVASAQVLVGSFKVDDGPDWPDDPPTYNCLEACALVFGGQAGDYQCSTSDQFIDNKAFVSAFGTARFCTEPVSETFKTNTHYACGGDEGCSASAYVDDQCNNGETNYCYASGRAAMAPAMSFYPLIVLALALLTVGALRHRRRLVSTHDGAATAILDRGKMRR